MFVPVIVHWLMLQAQRDEGIEIAHREGNGTHIKRQGGGVAEARRKRPLPQVTWIDEKYPGDPAWVIWKGDPETSVPSSATKTAKGFCGIPAGR